MIRHIIMCSLVITGSLLMICSHLSKSSDTFQPDVSYFSTITKETSDTCLKDIRYEGIVRHSIEILCSMGWSDEKIRDEIPRFFNIDDSVLDEIFKNNDQLKGDEKMKSNSQKDNIHDMMRESIVEKSVEILRRHGKSDSEIREMMLRDFSISDEALNKIMENGSWDQKSDSTN